MIHAEADFVERLAGLLEGMPRVAGRMWAWLLICDPPQQTAADLAAELRASRGAISGAARLLESAGLIHRQTRRGDRREYYSVPPGSIVELLARRTPQLRAWRETAEVGLGLLRDTPPQRRHRLEEVHAVFTFMEREMLAILDRFLVEQAARPARTSGQEET